VLHNKAGVARVIRDGRIDTLAGECHGNGGARAGRERVRRRDSRRVRAPGRRTASQRAGRGSPGGLVECRSRRAAGDLRSGGCPGGGDDPAVARRARACARARDGAARGVCPRRFRCMVADAAGVRHDATGRGAGVRDRLRARRLPGPTVDRRGDRGRVRVVHARMDDLGRGLATARSRAGDWDDDAQRAAGRNLRSCRCRRRTGDGRSRGPD